MSQDAKAKSETPQPSTEKPNSSAKGPAGGFDSTLVPKHPDSAGGYTVKLTFHSAQNLPAADFHDFTCDPYIQATLHPHGVEKRHEADNDLTWRTSTKHSMEPVWNEDWVIANVPSGGFKLKLRLYDEDPEDNDDRLGNVHIHVDRIDDSFETIKEKSFPIKKTSGSWRAYGFRYCAFALGIKKLNANVVVSIEVLGKTEVDNHKVYTLGPNVWTKHYSPLLGRLTGTKGGKDDKGVEKVDFEANQMQLTGPVPDELYHRYVEFKSFVAPMFTKKGLGGKTLSYLLRTQHNRIYIYDKQTKSGRIDGPGEELALRFLESVHFDQGARLFTYVLMLDGQFRYTETGKEFGIDLLSKHTMHSKVSQYIACSGEFLVRRVRNSKEREKPVDQQETHPDQKVEGGPPSEGPPRDVTKYELLIDNDSGTYRPKGDLMPLLQKFLEFNFKGLKVLVMTCDDDKLQNIKKKQRDLKKKEGDKRVYRQRRGSSTSISSSEASDLDDAVAAHEAEGKNNEEQGLKEKVANGFGQLKDSAHPMRKALEIAERKH